MRRLPWFHAVLALVGGLATLAAPAQDMFRGDPAHRGVAPAAPGTFHRVKWAFPTGARIVSSPVSYQDLVIFGSDDGNLYAVEAASGRQRWVVRTRGPVASTPAVADGRVYAASYDGRMYAVDARTGEVAWKFATEGERRFEARGLHGMTPKSQTYPDPYDVFLSSAAVAGRRVFFGSGDGHVYALDAETGSLIWKHETGDVVHASPALADGLVVVGSWDGRLYALDAATGAARWTYQAGTDPLIHNQQGFQSSAAVVDGTVFVGCRDGHLYAIDAGTGSLKWSIDTAGSWVVGSPAVAAGRVYFATSDSALYRVVDAATGAPVLQQSTQAYVFSSPVVAGDVVLVGVLNGILQARDRNGGALLWEFRTDASRANLGWVLTKDAHFNSALLFPSSWGDVDFQGAQRQQTVGSFFSTPLVRDRTVYIGSADGRLYAIE
jgi:outer membrane protein assembly factor BamB